MTPQSSGGTTGPAESFITPIGRGMRPAETVPISTPDQGDLLDRLDEFDACRNRGAVEARTAWLR